MRKFIHKLSLLIFLIFIVDYIVGQVLTYIDNCNESEKSNNYIMSRVNQDILIFGSSRAYRHYDTRIISESLGMTCFNCGQTGQGVIHNYALLSAITGRYIPKLIIYDIYPLADFLQGDNIRYIKDFLPYKDNKVILKVLLRVDNMVKIKSFSKMFCYNDICNNMLLTFLKLLPDEECMNGFVPTNKKMDVKKLKLSSGCTDTFDNLKLKFLRDFLQISNKTKIVLVMSPIWYGEDKKNVKLANMLAKKYNIPFIDFTANTKYVHNNEYFYDGIHMNSEGAKAFTKDLIKQMQKK